MNFPAGPGAYALAAGDLEGNGKVDLVVADSNLSGSSYVTVLLGNGDGTFTRARRCLWPVIRRRSLWPM